MKVLFLVEYADVEDDMPTLDQLRSRFLELFDALNEDQPATTLRMCIGDSAEAVLDTFKGGA